MTKDSQRLRWESGLVVVAIALVFVGILHINRPQPEEVPTGCTAVGVGGSGAPAMAPPCRLVITDEARTAAYTADLAEITALLVAATGFLAFYTFNLWKTTGIMAMEAADATQTTAEKMQASVDAQLRAAEAMEKSAAAMTVSADATEAMFYAAHPPELMVEDVRLDVETEIVTFAVVNRGGSDAQITASNATIGPHYVGQPLPRVIPYSSERDTLGQTSYDLGVKVEHTIAIPTESLVVGFAQAVPEDITVALFGYIEYSGHNGKRFTNRFYRIWQHDAGDFVAAGSQYERTQ